VEFEMDGEEWSVDEDFPMALKTKRRVKPERITGMLILSVKDLYERLIGTMRRLGRCAGPSVSGWRAAAAETRRPSPYLWTA